MTKPEMTTNDAVSETTVQVQDAAKSLPKGASGKTAAFDQAMMASTSVSNLSELRAQAPDLYQGIVKGLAQQIVNQMKKHTERFRKIQRENRHH